MIVHSAVLAFQITWAVSLDDEAFVDTHKL